MRTSTEKNRTPGMLGVTLFLFFAGTLLAPIQTAALDKNARQGRIDCKFPLQYSLGRIDKAFGVSEKQLSAATLKAAEIWRKALGKTLFAETAKGPLKVGLVYDERQKETQMLKKMGLTIERNKTSFGKIQTAYNNLAASYKKGLASYNASVKNLETERGNLNRTADYWNGRGGAPESEYAVLQTRQSALEKKFTALGTELRILNETVKTLNSLAAVLNQMAEEMNLEIEKYNTSGVTVRDVFNAGAYESDRAGRRIFIYQFENLDKLSAVMAHEFGHALGLEHNDNPNSIMYKLNEGQIQKVTAEDVTTLKKACSNLK